MAEPPKDPFIDTPFQVGKYPVSLLTRPIEAGGFAAAVSIRRGAVSMTHDRVMRFVPVFDTHDRATRFASERALAWLGRSAPESHPSTIFQE